MFYTKKFCCCDLHTGTLVFAILSVILSGGTFLGYLIDMCVADDVTSTKTVILMSSVVRNNATNNGTEGPVDVIVATNRPSYGIVGATINFIISVCLLYGALKEKRTYLLPWLVMSAIGICIFMIALLIMMFVYPVIILLWIIIVPYTYVWLCVLSYYQFLDPMNPNHGTQVPVYITDQPMATYAQPQPYYNPINVQPEAV